MAFDPEAPKLVVPATPPNLFKITWLDWIPKFCDKRVPVVDEIVIPLFEYSSCPLDVKLIEFGEEIEIVEAEKIFFPFLEVISVESEEKSDKGPADLKDK